MQNIFKITISLLLAFILASCTPNAPNHSSSSNMMKTSNFSHKTALLKKMTNVKTSYIALEAGSKITAGNYVTDTNYFSLGSNSGNQNGTATVTNVINTNNLVNSAPQSVYQTQRWATHMTYTIHNLTANAAYTVRLHFVESWATAVGQRVFGVTINGVPVLTAFDIFQSAGGQNIALIKESTIYSNPSGNIVIQFDATVNNALINGIEIFGAWPNSTIVPSPMPSPIPSPNPTSSPTGGSISCVPNGSQFYPVFSACFTGNSPFHHTVVSMIASGIESVDNNSGTMASNVMAKKVTPSITDTGGGNGAMWLGLSNQSSYNTSGNTTYTVPLNEPGNTGDGQVHLPTLSELEGSDRHNNAVDIPSQREWDGEGCPDGSANNCNHTTWYPFSGPGFGNTGSWTNASNASMFAAGIYAISAQEIINFINSGGQQHIGHAMEFQTGYCEPSPNGMWPSIPNCDSANSNWPAYGEILHIKSSVNVDQISGCSFSSNPVCNAFAHALQDFGAYLGDTNQGGNSAVEYEYPHQYDFSGQGYPTNPWTSTQANGTSIQNLANNAGLAQIPNEDVELVAGPPSNSPPSVNRMPTNKGYWHGNGSPGNW